MKSFLSILYLMLQMSIFPFEVQRLYQAMENHWNIFANKFEVRVLNDYSSQSRKVIIIYSIMMYLAVTAYVTTPLNKSILFDIIWPFNESRFFAISIEWKIDTNKYYVPIICYNTILIMMDTIILIDIDSIYITRIVACNLFSIVRQFEKMMLKSNINMKVSKCCGRCMNAKVKECINAIFKLASEHVIYQEYVICLKKFQIALELVDILNCMYRTMVLITLLTGCTILSLNEIQVVLAPLEKVVKNIDTVITLLHIILFCYPGQKLDENQNVFYQIYAVEWYTFSSRLKSLLILILLKTFISCDLTAGNVFSLLMATYAAIVRTGISYFMTFLSLKD